MSADLPSLGDDESNMDDMLLIDEFPDSSESVVPDTKRQKRTSDDNRKYYLNRLEKKKRMAEQDRLQAVRKEILNTTPIDGELIHCIEKETKECQTMTLRAFEATKKASELQSDLLPKYQTIIKALCDSVCDTKKSLSTLRFQHDALTGNLSKVQKEHANTLDQLKNVQSELDTTTTMASDYETRVESLELQLKVATCEETTLKRMSLSDLNKLQEDMHARMLKLVSVTQEVKQLKQVCQVCLESKETTLCAIHPCGHLLCRGCHKTWLTQKHKAQITCGVCRQNLQGLTPLNGCF